MGKGNKCSGDDQRRQGGTETDLEAVLEYRNKYRKIIHAGIAQWVKDFQDGRIKIDTVEDLKKLIEIETLLLREELYLRKINSRQ